MNKLKKILLHPATTIAAFVLAAGLLLFGSVGGARAALQVYSNVYKSQVSMQDIGVTLLENGQDISWRNYDTELAMKDRESDENNGLAAEDYWNQTTGKLVQYMQDNKLVLGKPYQEELNVSNSGTIDQYVRVTVYKYWMDGDVHDETSEKLRELSPDMIDLHLVNLVADDSAEGWILDESASTDERTVLYYTRLLPSGQQSLLFADKLTINMATALKAETIEHEDGTFEVKYNYDGVTFCLEARVDAVQDHNASAAVLSAWGKQVTVNEEAGTLDLG